MLPPHVATVFYSCRDPPQDPAAGELLSSPPTLQLLDPSGGSAASQHSLVRDELDMNLEPVDAGAPGDIAELAAAPPAVGGHLSPRRSQRLRQAYDSVRLGFVECAAKRKAAAPGSGSGAGLSRRSGSSSSRRKKSKMAAVAGLLELPLLSTPSPLTRRKLKQIAEVCDLNAAAILDQASLHGSPAASSALAGSPTDSSSCASSVRVLSSLYD